MYIVIQKKTQNSNCFFSSKFGIRNTYITHDGKVFLFYNAVVYKLLQFALPYGNYLPVRVIYALRGRLTTNGGLIRVVLYIILFGQVGYVHI